MVGVHRSNGCLLCVKRRVKHHSVIKGFLLVRNVRNMGNLALAMTGASNLLPGNHTEIGVNKPIQEIINMSEVVLKQR
ncbi:hypothetical protein N7461_005458 [Penicillium sp. DV-2018c]|nr:hypothetical protein N7461_005458 [Penicillium sp. DV-2018c]